MGIQHYNRDQLAETIGNNLRDARKARNLTQAQVAEAISVSNEFYARLERGKALPSAETLLSLVTELGVTADSLFGDTIKPIPLTNPLDDLSPRRAQLARRIMALEAEAQRVISLLLSYCEQRFGTEADD